MVESEISTISNPEGEPESVYRFNKRLDDLYKLFGFQAGQQPDYALANAGLVQYTLDSLRQDVRDASEGRDQCMKADARLSLVERRAAKLAARTKSDDDKRSLHDIGPEELTELKERCDAQYHKFGFEPNQRLKSAIQTDRDHVLMELNGLSIQVSRADTGMGWYLFADEVLDQWEHGQLPNPNSAGANASRPKAAIEDLQQEVNKSAKKYELTGINTDSDKDAQRLLGLHKRLNALYKKFGIEPTDPAPTMHPSKETAHQAASPESPDWFRFKLENLRQIVQKVADFLSSYETADDALKELENVSPSQNKRKNKRKKKDTGGGNDDPPSAMQILDVG